MTLGTLSDERRKLLKLYYADGISMEGFKEEEEEERLAESIETARAQATEEQLESLAMNDLELRFEQVADLLREIEIDAFWEAANEEERRVLIQELIEWVEGLPGSS